MEKVLRSLPVSQCLPWAALSHSTVSTLWALKIIMIAMSLRLARSTDHFAGPKMKPFNLSFIHFHFSCRVRVYFIQMRPVAIYVFGLKWYLSFHLTVEKKVFAVVHQRGVCASSDKRNASRWAQRHRQDTMPGFAIVHCLLSRHISFSFSRARSLDISFYGWVARKTASYFFWKSFRRQKTGI